MKSDFFASDRIILDLANNHQGEVSHGQRIISEIRETLPSSEFRLSIKFQFRDLPAFVHQEARSNSDNKHVRRFLDTQLSWDDYERLLADVRSNEFSAICTPFDETSVEKVREMGFDAVKIASCSANDWPLLEKIAGVGLPVIASTGALSISQIDDLVSFLEHRGCDFALMHCVSLYPTGREFCNVSNIRDFKRRYPRVAVGWSTHESPDDHLIGPLAMASGATIFERHVGVATESYSLNAYSSTPNQIAQWINVLNDSRQILGSERREGPSEDERKSVVELQRGVYAGRDLDEGEVLSREDIFFAFPVQVGQVPSGRWRPGLKTTMKIRSGEAVRHDHLVARDATTVEQFKNCIHEVKALLNYAGVRLEPQFTTEFSHHYGVERFREWGATLINVINRNYAKKVLVMLPGQRHPNHFHKLKEETFLVVDGFLDVDLQGNIRRIGPGETLLVPPGVFHSFSSESGCVFEEISTTAFRGDSVYQDESINRLEYESRKTIVDNWGRFQLDLLMQE